MPRSSIAIASPLVGSRTAIGTSGTNGGGESEKVTLKSFTCESRVDTAGRFQWCSIEVRIDVVSYCVWSTAAALVSERTQALAVGMNDFLTKPIDAPKLRRTLARHVRKAPGTETVDSV